MSASGLPLCRVCLKEHWSREPHILPANAKGEVRSKRVVPTNGADTNCRTLRTQARMPEGMPGSGGRGMNGQREVSRQGIVRPTNTAPAPRSPRRDGKMNDTVMKNTSREGRDVVKPKGTSTERDHRDAQPATATPGKPAGKKGQRRAAKPSPGKRKPRTKKKGEK